MKAPDFTLADQDGTNRSLADYAGQWVVLYFYPKDDTPGCTVEACSFRDGTSAYREKGIAVLGVSADSPASHKKFAEKYSLPFTLLSDPKKETIKAYGAWGPKKFMGKEFEGILRKTFLIAPDGEIAQEYPKVTPDRHAEAVLADIERLAGS